MFTDFTHTVLRKRKFLLKKLCNIIVLKYTVSQENLTHRTNMTTSPSNSQHLLSIFGRESLNLILNFELVKVCHINHKGLVFLATML